MTPRELRVAAASLQAEAQALLDKHAADPEGIPEAVERDFNTKVDEARGLVERAKKIEALYERVKPAGLGDDLAADLAGRGHRPALAETGAGSHAGRVEVSSDEADKRGFTMGEFCQQVAIVGDPRTNYRQREQAENLLKNKYKSEYRAWDSPDRPKETRAVAQQSGTAGGFLVPELLLDKVMAVAAENSIMRRISTVIKMDADTVRIPFLNQTTAPTSGNTAYFGGLTLTWTGEAATLVEKDPTFNQAVLTAHELTGYSLIDRTLLQNSVVSVDTLINDLFGKAVGWYEDYAFINGTGAGQPLGWLNSPANITSSSRASGTALALGDFAKVYAKMLPASMNQAVWVISINALPTYLQTTGVSGGVILPAGFYSPDGAERAPVMTLFGRPLYVTEKLPALDTQGDVNFIDGSYYMVGDRRQMEIAASEHFKFQNNQIAFRVIHRVGGMPWINGPITLQDTTTTVSPFVTMHT